MIAIIRRDLLWLPIVLAAVLLIYLPGLDNGLVFDDGYLADGELYNDYRSALDFRARMLSYGSFVWLHALLGDGWWKQRLFNVLLHMAVVVALWAFYREILRHIAPATHASEPRAAESFIDSPALGFAIGFFALNPVAVYSVAYLIQRSIVMATFFVLLALFCFAKGLRLGKATYYAGALAAYGLAVMSKEHAVLAPLAALPIYVLVKRPSGGRLAIVAAAGAALMGIAAFALWQRYGDILGRPFDEYSRVYLQQLAQLRPGADSNAFGLSVMNEAWLFFVYGVRWLLPVAEWMSISMRPPFPLTWATFPQFLGLIGYVGLIVGNCYLLLRYRDWRALIATSMLLAALLFPTEFSTVWVQDPFVLYRSYLWAIGIPGLVFFVVHGPSSRVVAMVAVAVGTFFIWQSLDRVFSLATPETAWTDAIRKLPEDPRSVGRWFPYLNRGAAYVDSNQFKLAMRDFERSAQLGDLGMGVFNVGALLAASGRHQEALQAFDKAEREGYNLYNLPFQRGLSLMALDRLQEARKQLIEARDMKPPSPAREIVLLNLGRIDMRLHNAPDALFHLRLLLTVDPENKEGKRLLPMALIMNNEYAAARDALDRLMKEEPEAGYYYERALANYGLKRKSDALTDIDAAIRLGLNNANVQQWRARIQTMP